MPVIPHLRQPKYKPLDTYKNSHNYYNSKGLNKVEKLNSILEIKNSTGEMQPPSEWIPHFGGKANSY